MVVFNHLVLRGLSCLEDTVNVLPVALSEGTLRVGYLLITSQLGPLHSYLITDEWLHATPTLLLGSKPISLRSSPSHKGSCLGASQTESAMKSRRVGIHDGPFHADEVTACALLILADRVDIDQIVRTRDPTVLDDCEYVCDVGGIYDPAIKRFDHHQSDYTGSFSSAGMILKYLHEEQAFSDLEFKALNESLVIGVDAHDNGKAELVPGHCSFSNVVSNYMPIERGSSSKEGERAFREALEFVVGHVKRLLARVHYIESCRSTVKAAMDQSGDCMFFEDNIPWLENYFEMGGEDHPARFIVMPSGDHWKLRGVPPSWDDRMSVREPLPEAWAGLLEGQLKEATGIDGALFCHKGRFISVWETKEDALKAYEMVKSQRS